MSPDEPLLYGELAPWFHLLTAPEDYEDEAELYRALLVEACDGPVRTVLELGSGGGNNASHMKEHFELTLVDRSAGDARAEPVAEPRVPPPGRRTCEHVRLRGDLRRRLRPRRDRATSRARTTWRPRSRRCARIAVAGGAALFVPDLVAERFEQRTWAGGHDGDDGRGCATSSGSWDPDPDDTTYVGDFAYLLRQQDGTVRCVQDRHVCGLFPRATWLDLIEAGGLRG